MRRKLAALLFALLSAAPAPAAAEPTPRALGPHGQAIEQGERGLQAFRQGDWAPAYRLFEAAEGLVHSPVFLLYMARSREQQGELAEALELYARVTSEVLGDSAPESWRTAVTQATLESDALRARLKGQASVAPPPAIAPKPHERERHPRTTPPPPALNRRPRAAIAAGSVGAAGLALGATAGLLALLKLNAIKGRCEGRRCDPRDQATHEAATLWGRLADLGFVVAGAGLVTTGGILWLVPDETAGARSGSGAKVVLSGQLRF